MCKEQNTAIGRLYSHCLRFRRFRQPFKRVVSVFLILIDIYINMLCKVVAKKLIFLILSMGYFLDLPRICLLCQREAMFKRARKGHL